MAQNLNIDETLLAWADIVIKNWQRKIIDLNIGYSGQLYDSFSHEIIKNSGGKAERIDFMFAFYGRFVDMGVGRDIPIGNPGDVNTRRKPKKWYSPVWYTQTIKLSEILSAKYGILGAAVISENITEGEKKYAPKIPKAVKPGLSQLPANRPLTELDRVWMRRNGLL